jgi:hypothetical protein
MSPLNIHPEENVDTSNKKKSNKTLKVLLGVGVLVLVPVIGSTLAAQITITNSPVEFGQGVVQTTACDDAVVVTPDSVFTNAAGAGDFYLDSVTLSDIASGCDGKSFAIKVYDNTGTSPVVSCTEATYDVVTTLSGSFCAGVGGMEYSYENDTLTVSFTPANIFATSVYKITVETSDAA